MLGFVPREGLEVHQGYTLYLYCNYWHDVYTNSTFSSHFLIIHHQTCIYHAALATGLRCYTSPKTDL